MLTYPSTPGSQIGSRGLAMPCPPSRPTICSVAEPRPVERHRQQPDDHRRSQGGGQLTKTSPTANDASKATTCKAGPTRCDMWHDVYGGRWDLKRTHAGPTLPNEEMTPGTRRQRECLSGSRGMLNWAVDGGQKGLCFVSLTLVTAQEGSGLKWKGGEIVGCLSI